MTASGSAREPSGWVTFAVALFFVLGAMNVIYGVAMLANSEWVVFTAEGVWLLDLTGWGYVNLILGILQLFVGWGVMTEQNWARITGIVIAVLGAIIALFVMPIYALWGVFALAIAILVIYALSAHAAGS